MYGLQPLPLVVGIPRRATYVALVLVSIAMAGPVQYSPNPPYPIATLRAHEPFTPPVALTSRVGGGRSGRNPLRSAGAHGPPSGLGEYRRRALPEAGGWQSTKFSNVSGAIGILPGFVRDEDFSDHPRRKRLLEEIRKNPGIHYRELQRRTGIAGGDLRYHLRKLSRARLISIVEKFGEVHFFDSGLVAPETISRCGIGIS